jgi:hypothetical protein
MSHLKASLVAAALLLFQSLAMGEEPNPADFLEFGDENYRAAITMVDGNRFTGVVVERGHHGWALIAYNRRTLPFGDKGSQNRMVL